MSQWCNESMNHWTSETMNEQINESTNQWSNELMNQWRSESANQWINEAVIQWISESMNHWTNESVNDQNWWMGGWMDGWTSELLFFVELLLHWATPSLRHLFSQLYILLLWAATDLGYFCSELPPAGSSVASATQVFSLRSAYTAFSNLQLQSRKAQE